ncbi:hypothetical protein [Vagococcus salmoninarum]|uniref:hypothetical protein n=1 Tax=Vagococcus salmoninarum TaxID=2739 RepID=UPI003F94C6F8
MKKHLKILVVFVFTVIGLFVISSSYASANNIQQVDVQNRRNPPNSIFVTENYTRKPASDRIWVTRNRHGITYGGYLNYAYYNRNTKTFVYNGTLYGHAVRP